MLDYMLVVGDGEPYGFAAVDDAAAFRHAADYLKVRQNGAVAASALPVTLTGPTGVLTRNDETLAGFEARLPLHSLEATDDVRPADPTPPDCNMA